MNRKFPHTFTARLAWVALDESKLSGCRLVLRFPPERGEGWTFFRLRFHCSQTVLLRSEDDLQGRRDEEYRGLLRAGRHTTVRLPSSYTSPSTLAARPALVVQQAE